MTNVQPKKILLVEDETIIALMERRVLESAGYTVVVVHSGEGAIEAVGDSVPPDLILMDIDLGQGIDGTEAARRILETSVLPIVFLSSHTEPEIVARTEEITSYGYIVKNSGDTVLLASIRTAFRLWDAHRELELVNQRIAHTNSYLNTIQDATPVGFIVVDTDGYLRDANRSYCRSTGFDRGELVGRHMSEVDVDETPEATHRHTKAMLDGRALFFQAHHVRKGGGSVPLEISVRPIETDEGMRLIAFCRDMTTRTSPESSSAETERSEARYRSLFENSSSVMLVIDPADGRILRANPSAERFYGWKRDVLTSMRIQDINQATAEELQQKMAAAKGRQCNVFQFRHRCASGEMREIESFASPITWEGRTVLHSIIHDISDRVALEAERTKLVGAVEHSANVVVITDANGFIEYANPRFTELTGYEMSEVVGKKTNILNSDMHSESDYAELWRTIASGDIWRGKFHNSKKSGERYWESASIAPIHDEAGEITSFVKIAEDVTERTEHEQLLNETAAQLQMAVVRQETLMAELNHRVKNNLAMVASLVRLENDRLGDAADLTDILARITTITAIHQQLQDSGTYDTVELGSYVTEVVANAMAANPSVEVTYELESVRLPTKTAVTIGLITNEIATNAVKYGFNEREAPRFYVTSHCDGTFCEFKVTNSGNPFPEDVDLDHTPSLGLRLISMLVDQLHGHASLTRTPQPLYTIRIPIDQITTEGSGSAQP